MLNRLNQSIQFELNTHLNNDDVVREQMLRQR